MKRTMAMKRRSNYTWIIRLIAALAVVIAACTQMGMVYHTDETYISVKIHSGDTVWQIASAAASPETDVRDVVDEIMDINHIRHSDDIYPGQVLQVPVESSRADTVKEVLHGQ